MARPRPPEVVLTLFFLAVSIAGLVIRVTGDIWLGHALILAGVLAALIHSLWRRRHPRTPSG